MPSWSISLWSGKGVVAGSPALRARSWTPKPTGGISDSSVRFGRRVSERGVAGDRGEGVDGALDDLGGELRAENGVGVGFEVGDAAGAGEDGSDDGAIGGKLVRCC